MNSKYRYARRSAFALGPCVLLLSPLTAFAQAAPDAKPAEQKQADAPASGETYTLRMKFKQGDINRYKMKVTTRVVSPSGLGGETKTTDNDASMVSEQKTTKLLDSGAAEIITTLTSFDMKTDGKTSGAPNIPTVTMQMTPTGKVLSTKSEDTAATDALKNMFTSAFSSPQSFLPNDAVTIGAKWTQTMNLPGAVSGKEGTMDCSLTRIETVNGVKTALIHAIMKVPMLAMLDAMGQPTKVESDAMALFDGTIVSNMDINFAIDEGRIVRTVSSGDSEIAIKLGKAAPAEAAAFLPKDAKVTMKMNMNMSLLAPGERVAPPKSEEAKPEEPAKK